MVPAERISRFLSFLLRHQPREYPLSFDRRGFVSWDDLVYMAQERFPDVAEEEIRRVVEEPDKQRFELKEGKVRATYGHSFPVDLGPEAAEPPAELYIGTARDLAQSILQGGLKPRDRRYIHLSASLEEARAVGERRDPAPAIIVVDAATAHTEGIRFYQSGPLFLVESVPAKYLSQR
ncbi:MAG: RNA 2'-phosphotransferase [Deltaproteobacteria bacterium]|nr:RNA 2'-phosphotransferase [Deltaproteobacteria bacterium]